MAANPGAATDTHGAGAGANPMTKKLNFGFRAMGTIKRSDFGNELSKRPCHHVLCDVHGLELLAAEVDG